MKSFKQLIEEKLNEGNDRYPADEMTMKELKIACYAAQNILDMLEDGAMIQRWQISAIVKASEELSSVYTSISTDEQDYYGSDEWEDEEEPQYVGFEYPSVFEETNLNEIQKSWSSTKGHTVKTKKGTFGAFSTSHNPHRYDIRMTHDEKGNKLSAKEGRNRYAAFNVGTHEQAKEHLNSLVKKHEKE